MAGAKGPPRTAVTAGNRVWAESLGHWEPQPHHSSPAGPDVATCGPGPVAAHSAAPEGHARPEPHRATSSLWVHLGSSPNLGPAGTQQNCYMIVSVLSSHRSLWRELGPAVTAERRD